jgi:hypothetical protein
VRKLARFVVVVALLTGLMQAALPPASAAELKPAVVVSFAGFNEMTNSVETLAKLSGKPGAGAALEGMINMMTGGKGLAGINKDAPCGVLIGNVEAGEPTIVGFLPLSDVKQQIELLKTRVGVPVEENNGTWEIAIPRGPKLTIAQRGAWACFSNDKAQLESLSEDPSKLLGDLPKKYLFAYQILLKNLPEQLIDQTFSAYQMILPMMMRQNPNESDEMYAMRLKVVQYVLGEWKTTMKDLDEMLIGVQVDRQANQVTLDMQMTPKSGSNMAQQAELMKSVKTDFAGFDLPGALLTVHKAVALTDADVTKHKATLQAVQTKIEEEIKNQGLADKEAQLAQELVKDAFGMMIQTVESKKIDSGAVIKADDKMLFAAAGMAVADGKKLEAILKKLAAAAKEEGLELADKIKFDAQTHQGIRFHTLAIPTPEEDMKSLVGDNLDIIIGVGDTQVFVAAGRDVEKTLKDIIDQSKTQAGKQVLPLEAKFALTPLFQMIAATAPNEKAKADAQKVLPLLQQSAGKDHITVTMQPEENNIRLRVVVEEGVVKAIGSSIPTMGPPGMTPPPAAGGNPFGE